ncbi:MAG: DNA/RNA non-specific endonuclease [Treponema sp.]|nr:DNA/RNA non-specific endonuclease [Treponema sp.]
MKKILFFALLLSRLAFIVPCELPDHFDFNVSNNGETLYSGCYDAVHKGPHIIEYILVKKRAESGGVKRPSAQFTQGRDGGILRNLLREHGHSLPHHQDFTRSGYDRGHMAPNGDFNDTRRNAIMTFFIANIWPQTPEVNRVEWLKAERETRRLAVENLAVKVIIIVDEFTDQKVGDIQVPLNFKRRVYDAATNELIYAVVVYQKQPQTGGG